ncbi:MAG: sulfatase-like hydrolase/transferase, partial [Opitutae bacterium]|nr:sulfatase-like hydrolase/transferase [Opitutae bacterium]
MPPFPVNKGRALRIPGSFVVAVLFTLLFLHPCSAKPNILFIAIDDLNDWVGCLGGHPQAKTPNLDRLAASGMLFTNAHCPAPACNPSRTAIFTGISPHRSGLYANGQKMRDVLPDTEILSKTFSRAGYWSA